MASRDTYTKPELRRGTKAYYVTRYGRTLGVVERVFLTGCATQILVEMRVTSCRRGAYKVGEIVTAGWGHIMPRECYRVKRGSYGTKWYALPYTPIVTED